MNADTRTEADFKGAVIHRYIPAILRLLAHKGAVYSPAGAQALVNFYEGAKLVVDTPEHYLLVQATKQWHVISEWSREADARETGGKEIVNRVLDLVVYLLLLLFMLDGRGDMSKAFEKDGVT